MLAHGDSGNARPSSEDPSCSGPARPNLQRGVAGSNLFGHPLGLGCGCGFFLGESRLIAGERASGL